jgi:hypothetical protein
MREITPEDIPDLIALENLNAKVFLNFTPWKDSDYARNFLVGRTAIYRKGLMLFSTFLNNSLSAFVLFNDESDRHIRVIAHPGRYMPEIALEIIKDVRVRAREISIALPEQDRPLAQEIANYFRLAGYKIGSDSVTSRGEIIYRATLVNNKFPGPCFLDFFNGQHRFWVPNN